MCLVARNRVWSFDVDQLERDVLPTENGRSAAPAQRLFRSYWVIEDRLAISAASPRRISHSPFGAPR